MLPDIDWAIEGLPRDLADDLRRVWQALGREFPRSPSSLTALEVLRCHYLIAEYFRELGHGLSQPGVRSIHILQSAVSRQFVGFGGRDKWTDMFDVVATLFFGLVKNHAFHDANKRTALLAALYQMQCAKRVPDAPQKQFELLAERVAKDDLKEYPRYVKIAKNDDSEIRFIANFFRSKTRREDKREYTVSYRQFDILLRRHGLYLGSPHASKVTVYREIRRRRGVFRRKEEVTHEKLTQIGFRDWGTEVSGKDVKHVRSIAKLDYRSGIDSQNFFQGVDPIASLIAEYADLLKRLSRK